MPWYVVNGCRVHLKLSGKAAKNPPAPCCAATMRSGLRVRCEGISTFLCDWPVDNERAGGTCDAPLCAEHAHQVGPDRHYCHRHFALHAETNPELF